MNEQWCEIDECPISICNGPHFEVETDFGFEILTANQEPIGKPTNETPEG